MRILSRSSIVEALRERAHSVSGQQLQVWGDEGYVRCGVDSPVTVPAACPQPESELARIVETMKTARLSVERGFGPIGDRFPGAFDHRASKKMGLAIQTSMTRIEVLPSNRITHIQGGCIIFELLGSLSGWVQQGVGEEGGEAVVLTGIIGGEDEQLARSALREHKCWQRHFRTTAVC